MRLLVTGGAGFIGSAVCRHLIAAGHEAVINVDALTYAGNLASLKAVDTHDNYKFVKADISDEAKMLE
ncbi:MAG: NAD-dependent epimerase/dehydratase family protein, partial [Henriciella sp.]